MVWKWMLITSMIQVNYSYSNNSQLCWIGNGNDNCKSAETVDTSTTLLDSVRKFQYVFFLHSLLFCREMWNSTVCHESSTQVLTYFQTHNELSTIRGPRTFHWNNIETVTSCCKNFSDLGNWKIGKSVRIVAFRCIHNPLYKCFDPGNVFCVFYKQEP